MAAKIRVAPVGGATIPRLELLSGLILSKLIDNARTALGAELQFDDPVYFSDSKVALFWIQGTNHEWKQFVECFSLQPEINYGSIRFGRSITEPNQSC